MYNNIVIEFSSDLLNKVDYSKRFFTLLPIAWFREAQGWGWGGWGHLIRTPVHPESGFFPDLWPCVRIPQILKSILLYWLLSILLVTLPPSSSAKVACRSKAVSLAHLCWQLVSSAPWWPLCLVSALSPCLLSLSSCFRSSQRAGHGPALTSQFFLKRLRLVIHYLAIFIGPGLSRCLLKSCSLCASLALC